MKKYAILTFVIVTALLSACGGGGDDDSTLPVDKPTVPGPVVTEPADPGNIIDPDAIRINIIENGKETGDSVAASPSYGKAGAEITIDYTLAETKINNRLTFSGTSAVIAVVNSAETGTRKYTIAEQDATDGVITIIATFAHSDKTLDTIEFADTDNETKTYGLASFTKAITNSGSGTGAISYESSDVNVATVNSSTGEVTILKVGSTTIIATKAGDETYEHATAEYLLTVEPLQLVIANPTVTTSKQYDGTATVTGTVTAGALTNKVGSDDVTVSVSSATYNSANVAEATTITVVYTITGADAGNYIKPIDYSTAGSITKADGAAVNTEPTAASKTDITITSSVVTTSGGQTVEYALGTGNSTPTTAWQSGQVFTGLTPSTTYYIFARSKEDDNHTAGTPKVSAAIVTNIDSNRIVVIDFDNMADGVLDSTQNNSSASSKATISLQPNGDGKAAQVVLSNWQQGLIIPVYLPSPLSDYEKVTFKFKATTTANMGTNPFMIYAANDKATFTGTYGWLGNTSGALYTGNLVGSKTHTTHTLNTWEDHEITANPVSAIQSLQGNIFIAIGFNQNSGTYQLDDIIFHLKDSVPLPSATILPDSGSFVKAVGFQEDIPLTMLLFNRTLTSITNGGALTSGTDYTINGNTVTLKKEYLNTFTANTKQTLTFNFNDSTSKEVTISILATGIRFDSTNWPDPLTFSAAGTTGTIVNGAVQVNKTGSNSTVTLLLPFKLGVGIKKLNEYTGIKVSIKALTGDFNTKSLRVFLGTTASSNANNYIGTLSRNFGSGNETSFTEMVIPFSTKGSGAPSMEVEGNITIGVGLENTNAVTYQIQYVELY